MDQPTGKTHIVRKAGIIGVGLDCTDGHCRITRGDEFLLLSGSEETHQLLQAKVAKFYEELALLGKGLEDITEDELEHIIQQMD